jgi:predicted CoA-binding protein
MNIALVGASNNPEKFGNRILLHLVREGHMVFPVNPKEKTILGIPCYRKVKDIPSPIDIVDIVVPPKITLKVLRHLNTLGGLDIWIQPGAGSPDVLAYLERHGRDFGKVTYEECIMTSLEHVYH